MKTNLREYVKNTLLESKTMTQKDVDNLYEKLVLNDNDDDPDNAIKMYYNTMKKNGYIDIFESDPDKFIEKLSKILKKNGISILFDTSVSDQGYGYFIKVK